MSRTKNLVHAGSLVATIATTFALTPAAASTTNPDAVIPQRAAALSRCTTESNHYPMYAWGSWPIYIYDACMARHRQVD